jgi:endonuclease YncB( thermonuclease family)
VLYKKVTVEWSAKNEDDCILGDMILDGRWINEEMVLEGLAWHLDAQAKSEVLTFAQSKARKAKSGLWKDKNPMAPWEFRKKL